MLSMNDPKLSAFASGELKGGVTPKEVVEKLVAVGWSEDEARGAVSAGLVANGVPVPEKGKRAGGRISSTVEVVANFFSFVGLGVVATALGVLYYQIINYYFPDPLVVQYGRNLVSTEAVHYAIAALIIAFPIYVVVIRLWFRWFREDEEKTETRLTKWLTYLVLLVTAFTIVGDLIAALYYFLQGEFTVRFLLKALTILVIAGTIFGFYVLERRKIQYQKDIPRSTFQGIGWGAGVLVLLAIALGFQVAGSPETARGRGLDDQRAQALRTIAGCVAGFGMDQRALPASLEALREFGQYEYCLSSINDPETKMPYEYRIVSASAISPAGIRVGTFELCAEFTRSSDGTTEPVGPYGVDKWAKHGTGRSCDTETVNLERSPEGSGFDAPTPMPIKGPNVSTF